MFKPGTTIDTTLSHDLVWLLFMAATIRRQCLAQIGWIYCLQESQFINNGSMSEWPYETAVFFLFFFLARIACLIFHGSDLSVTMINGTKVFASKSPLYSWSHYPQFVISFYFALWHWYYWTQSLVLAHLGVQLQFEGGIYVYKGGIWQETHMK